MNTARTLSYYLNNADKRRGKLNHWGLKSGGAEAKGEGHALVRFAGGAGANSDTLKKLAFLTDFSSHRDLLKLKGQIVKGEMEGLFPTEMMVSRGRTSAASITEYLGIKKVDLCIRKVLLKKNVDEEMRAERYLRWAAQSGAPGVRERALAGLAIIFGEKLKNQDSLIVRGSMLHANENAAVLRKELGRERTDILLKERQKGGKTEHWAIISLSACLGMGVGSVAGFLHELGAAGRPELRFAITFGLASLAAFIAVEISRARALPFLAQRIGGMLKEREGKAGQL
jgi:hypothetical protein